MSCLSSVACPFKYGGLSVRAGDEYRRMVRSVAVGKARFTGASTSHYRLNWDWVEPFKNVKCALGVVSITCEDLGNADRSKLSNYRTIAYLPGPKMTRNAHMCLVRTIVRARCTHDTFRYQGVDMVEAPIPVVLPANTSAGLLGFADTCVVSETCHARGAA